MMVAANIGSSLSRITTQVILPYLAYLRWCVIRRGPSLDTSKSGACRVWFVTLLLKGNEDQSWTCTHTAAVVPLSIRRGDSAWHISRSNAFCIMFASCCLLNIDWWRLWQRRCRQCQQVQLQPRGEQQQRSANILQTESLRGEHLIPLRDILRHLKIS